MAAKTYPLNPEGPLCPLLRDGDLLLDLYEQSGTRQEMKKFIKRNNWPGKPPLSYSLGPETMKKMLLSVLDTPQGRKRLADKTENADNPAVLYQVIWNWLCINNPPLIKAVDDFSHTENDKVFMGAKDLTGVLAARKDAEDIHEDETRHFAFLTLAFAMLQPEDAKALVDAFLKRHKEFKKPVGAR